MNSILKALRENKGYTQAILAEKSGLSIRTIQRIEKSQTPPKGHSLIAIAKVFQMESSALKSKYDLSPPVNDQSDKLALTYINIAIFSFFLIPFGNILIPLLIWNKKKNISPLVYDTGKRIINAQILWSIFLIVSLSLSPFILYNTFPSFPLILVVLLILVAINIIIIGLTAKNINQEKYNFLDLPIRLF